MPMQNRLVPMQTDDLICLNVRGFTPTRFVMESGMEIMVLKKSELEVCQILNGKIHIPFW